jgi:5-oxoprolinase (ATP-hydrolysing)
MQILEFRFPLTVEKFGIRVGSGGEGKFKGGNGIEREIRFKAPLTVSMLANHRSVPPFGLEGGGPGQVGENYLVRASGDVVTMGHRGTVEVEEGDTFVIKTPGGGGFGKKTEK